MNVADYGEQNAPIRPSERPTPQQYELARRYVARNAPDVYEVLFGGAA